MSVGVAEPMEVSDAYSGITPSTSTYKYVFNPFTGTLDKVKV